EKTIDQARTKAAELLAEIGQGKDPTVEKPETVSGDTTLGALWSQYLEQHAKPYKRSWRNDELLWGKHLKKKWAGRRLSEISRADIQTLMSKIGKDSGPGAANLTHSLLRKMLNCAIDWGYTGVNAATRIKRFAARSRTRYLRPDEMKRFLSALSEHPNEGFRDALLVMLMTGQRKMNVLTMRWAELDLDQGTWTIPAAKTKNAEEQTVPLMTEAVQVLEKRRERAKGSEWVFASKTSRSGHLMDVRWAFDAICERAKIEGLNPHDLRRTMGSWLAAGGVSEIIIGKSLGHLDPQATRVYTRLALDPVRTAMEAATAAMLEAAGRPREKAEVVDVAAAQE
ncbi:site-specific integrase, partial [bacterium]|nr:site-specific integrase [bacterium]